MSRSGLPTTNLITRPFTQSGGISGMYYAGIGTCAQVDDGWLTFRGVLDDGSGRPVAMVATYDGSQPTWALGDTTRTGFSNPTDVAVLYRVTPDPQAAFDPSYTFDLPDGLNGVLVGRERFFVNTNTVNITSPSPPAVPGTARLGPLCRLTLR